ncbi:unnamed protein product [Ambrosiozyma monospora]|uniref:Unnamed protein product n=1 Tax=Ambrosiozyma monospora TaxID=43982 RepID=A0A9W6T8V0_AMBMO|nr:unnamed protein product [Ambrosiozyma monospora]
MVEIVTNCQIVKLGFTQDKRAPRKLVQKTAGTGGLGGAVKAGYVVEVGLFGNVDDEKKGRWKQSQDKTGSQL